MTKYPREILPNVFAFAPNRDTLGGTAYFIKEETGNLLIDCPLWETACEDFLQRQGGVRWWIITHRGGIGKQSKRIQETLNSEVIMQEQEAYLLPEVPVTPFAQEFAPNSSVTLIWTPGHSPGSSCVYWSGHQGVLFTGRHLLPNPQGQLLPLRQDKTFHWPRQLQSVAKLKDRFQENTLSYICPGANIGFLRGKGFMDNAYKALATLDLLSLQD